MMETEGLNGTKPKAGEMQVMLTLYQLSSSLPAMALSHPLWVSKNSPGPKSGEEVQAAGAWGPCRVPTAPERSHPCPGAHVSPAHGPG